MRAGVALLALAAAASNTRAQPAPAGNATGNSKSSASGTAAATLPPHTGTLGGPRPLILFHDNFFGRDFVHREYAFEARRTRTLFRLGLNRTRLRCGR